jgi:hypothetical protein
MSGLANTQWLRKGSLLVSKAPPVSSDQEQPALDLSEMAYTFTIRQQEAGSPNNAIIRVYNLKDETSKQIQTEFTRVVLQVGYQYTSVGIIFDGTIVQTRSGRERNTDSYLDIMAAEMQLPYQYAVVNQTLAPDASAPKDQIAAINKATEPLGVKVETPTGMAQTGGTLPRGKVLFGMALADNLDRLAISNGYSWVVNQGKIQLVPLTGYLPGEAVVLNAATGLLHAEATQEGVKVTCLINPKIHVATRIQIDNKSINTVINRTGPAPPNPANPFSGAFATVTNDGFYRVIVNEFEGSSRGENWYQNLTCLAIDTTSSPDKSVKLYP